MTTESTEQPSLDLATAAARIQLKMPEGVIDALEEYCRRLWEWNDKINLTRHTNFDLFVRRDLLDTVKLAAHLDAGEDILDIGTGGGVPGVVLAILRPDLQVSVCDSVGKKAKVVQNIVSEMKLPVGVYPHRAEVVLEDLRFHSAVTRASGSISQLLTWVGDHWMQFDRLLAIKGPRWVEERGEARHRGLLANIDLRILETYPMPDTQSESVILSLQRKRR